MKKKTAEGVLESLAWMDFPLEMLAQIMRDESNEDDANRIMGYLKPIVRAQVDLMLYLGHENPDLDPIGVGKEKYFQYKLKYQTPDFPAKKLSDKDLEAAKKAGIEAANEITKGMQGE